MLRSRVIASVCLLVALLLGVAPLRICAHADSGHARVLILTAACHGHAEAAASCSIRPQPAQGSRDVERTTAARCGPGCSGGPSCTPKRHVHRSPTREPHGDRVVPAHAASHGHEGSGNDNRDHCHCSDVPLVVGQPLAPVALASPLAALAPCDRQHVAAARGACHALRAERAAPPQQRAALESIVLIR